MAAKLVSVPGSSSYFSGGIIAYSNEIKQNLLAVSLPTLTNHGAVSEETVKEMVDGALKILNTDVAISVSGIAGPDGGTESKPVGTIWLCVGNKDTKKSHLLKAGKNRQKNIEMATNVGLSLLLSFINNL